MGGSARGAIQGGWAPGMTSTCLLDEGRVIQMVKALGSIFETDMLKFQPLREACYARAGIPGADVEAFDKIATERARMRLAIYEKQPPVFVEVHALRGGDVRRLGPMNRYQAQEIVRNKASSDAHYRMAIVETSEVEVPA